MEHTCESTKILNHFNTCNPDGRIMSFFLTRLLQKGSRIVILIGINNNPDWQVNYGTGKDVNAETIRDATIPFRTSGLLIKATYNCQFGSNGELPTP